jgi:hypothetical protein
VATALVTTVPAPAQPDAAAGRPQNSAPGGSRPRADFLAQLIATVTQAPQTRVRRRAEPDEAIAAYGASDRAPARTGRAVSRSL